MNGDRLCRMTEMRMCWKTMHIQEGLERQKKMPSQDGQRTSSSTDGLISSSWPTDTRLRSPPDTPRWKYPPVCPVPECLPQHHLGGMWNHSGC